MSWDCLLSVDIVVAAIIVLWPLSLLSSLLLYLYIVAAGVMSALIDIIIVGIATIINHQHMCRHALDLRVVGK